MDSTTSECLKFSFCRWNCFNKNCGVFRVSAISRTLSTVQVLQHQFRISTVYSEIIFVSSLSDRRERMTCLHSFHSPLHPSDATHTRTHRRWNAVAYDVCPMCIALFHHFITLLIHLNRNDLEGSATFALWHGKMSCALLCNDARLIWSLHKHSSVSLAWD